MKKETTSVRIEIRECTWVNGKPTQWQGHAHLGDRPLVEPLISGMPAKSKVLARVSLNKSINEYKELAKGASAQIMAEMQLDQLREEKVASMIAKRKEMAEEKKTNKKG